MDYVERTSSVISSVCVNFTCHRKVTKCNRMASKCDVTDRVIFYNIVHGTGGRTSSYSGGDFIEHEVEGVVVVFYGKGFLFKSEWQPCGHEFVC